MTETVCRTLKQGRRPDVAYMSPELVAQFGQEAGLPQSFPLIAEIASPDDSVEGLFAKAIEYLASI
ncbi:Uma2 family endonuclease [Myxacorys almedinensis]|uniref:Uma2 family endonuclease n=1 Tax=Myxacorys almedinensis TaxID=2651157 RepID=UPI00192EAD24